MQDCVLKQDHFNAGAGAPDSKLGLHDNLDWIYSVDRAISGP